MRIVKSAKAYIVLKEGTQIMNSKVHLLVFVVYFRYHSSESPFNQIAWPTTLQIVVRVCRNNMPRRPTRMLCCHLTKVNLNNDAIVVQLRLGITNEEIDHQQLSTTLQIKVRRTLEYINEITKHNIPCFLATHLPFFLIIHL